jgi:hypothetical protein
MEIFRANFSTGRITVNGKTYKSVDEMPPDIRREYEQTMQKMMADRDRNGVPDILEHPSSNTGVASFGTKQLDQISVNGKTYNRLEDVPQEFREAIQRAMTSNTATPPRVPTPMVMMQTDGSSIGKWIILIAALLTAGAIGWLLRGGMH